MNSLLNAELKDTEEVSKILGEQYHIIIKDAEGKEVFNPSKIRLPENIKIVEINGDKIVSINEKFYKIDTDKIEYSKKIFEVTRISDYTNIMHAIKILQNDDKTGVLRSEQFTKEIAKLQQYNIPFCLVMIDIDNFKSINDMYGHIYGDEVLKKVSKILSRILRKGDVIGRFGGDEFILAISQSKEKEVKELFKKRIFWELKNNLNITISAGVKEYDNSLSYEENKHMADVALYFAKKKGKNRIENYEEWIKKEVFIQEEYK